MENRLSKLNDKTRQSVQNLQRLSNSTIHFEDRYATKKILGQGAFSVVYLAKDLETGEMVAVKQIKTRYLTDEDIEGLDSEISVMKTLDHPHIVKLLDFFATKSHCYVVQEVAMGGELFDRVAKKEAYTEKEAYELIKMLLLTIAYLHARGIAHRDLKPENILLTSPDDDADVKLCDFGFAKQTTLGKQSMSQKKGTPGYIAPEILKGEDYSMKADIWSLGCIFYVLLGGYQPFVGASGNSVQGDKEMEKRVINGEFVFHNEWWHEVSQDAKDLISKMLVVDPNERADAVELLQLPYFLERQDELCTHDIHTALKGMKRMVARRKLKAGMNTVLSVTRIRRSISREVLSDAQQEAQLAHVLEQKEKDHSSTDQDKSQGDGEDQDGSSGKGEGSDDLCTEPAVSSVSVDEGLTFETAETTSNA